MKYIPFTLIIVTVILFITIFPWISYSNKQHFDNAYNLIASEFAEYDVVEVSKRQNNQHTKEYFIVNEDGKAVYKVYLTKEGKIITTDL